MAFESIGGKNTEKGFREVTLYWKECCRIVTLNSFCRDLKSHWCICNSIFMVRS